MRSRHLQHARTSDCTICTRAKSIWLFLVRISGGILRVSLNQTTQIVSAHFVAIAAFVLSSGTLGAAMSGAISQTRSIAISYGTFHHPSPSKYTAPAHELAGRIIKRLWENWGTDKNGLRLNEVDLYNVNIPMVGKRNY